MSELRLDRLEKRWGSALVVEPLTLTVQSGEFLVLLGPSGCGKTTTMRMVAGLEEPSDGRIYLDNVDITEADPRQRNVAMVFQSYGLYPNMTVLENIQFPLKMRGEPKEIAREKALVAARTVEVDGLLDRKPKALSGGQRQRVALARAIVRRPSLFLMDEPLSNLDARLRASMRSYIKQLHQQLGVTTLYVTHDQIEAMTLADRIVVMSAARVQQIGTPHEVYHHPENMFVAGFVGAPPMNLIRGLMSEHGRVFCALGSKSTLRMPAAGPLTQGEVVLGIRPEHILLGHTNDQAGDARLESIEVTGDAAFIRLTLGNQSMVVRTSPGFLGKSGDDIPFRFDPESVSWFDPVTGQRI